MDEVQGALVAVGTAAGALIAVGTIVAALWKPGRLWWAKMGRALDIIAGTPEKRDPFSGTVIEEAVPDIGSRVTALEGAIAIGSAVEAKKIADQALQEVRALREVVHNHTRQLNEWQEIDRKKAEAYAASLTEVLSADLDTHTSPGGTS